MSGSILNNPGTTELNTIAFESGINTAGTIVPISFQTWQSNAPATYASDFSQLSVWNNDNQGNAILGTSNTRPAGQGGGVVTYGFDAASNFTAAQEQAEQASLQLWADEANISFAPANGLTKPDLLFTLNSGQGTNNQSPLVYTNLSAVGGTQIAINLTPSVQANSQDVITFDTSGGFGTLGDFSPAGNYGYSALVHEIGHLLGLGHPGPYNEGQVSGSSVPAVQFSPYDSRLWSVMSYIDPSDTTAHYYNQYSVTGTNWAVPITVGNTTTTYFEAPTTPQIDDILAGQELYGAATTGALTTPETFGFNTTITDATKSFFDFSVNAYPVVTLYDSSALGSTLDLSGYSTASTVNLNQGAFSSVAGLTNDIGIAFGTHIDTAIGGSGNNIFTVNGDSDTINGGTGGQNTVIFPDDESAYVVAGLGTKTVTVSSGGTIDTLTNVKTLQFHNGSVSTLCFAAGTRVATPLGPRAVDSLRPGDDVIATDSAGARRTAPVRWVGQRAVDLAGHPDPAAAAPVRIRAGAIAPGVPAAEVVLSPDHCIFLGGHLVRARRLINGSSVVQERPPHVVYVHVELHAHALLTAEGLLAESYREEGRRSFFEPLSGNAPPALIVPACAPFADDRVAEAVWRSIARRATSAAPAQAA